VEEAQPSGLAERMRAHAGVARLAEAFARAPGAHLVGGAVRDLLLGREPVDLDVVVEGDAEAAARGAAERLGGGVVAAHARFGTATVRVAAGAGADSLSFDVVTARAETYPAPGALPEVRPSSLEDDLARRDFAVNAIAAALWRDELGTVRAHPGALEDLEARVLRILHADSFRDDPTRLLRLVRYGARLDFKPDPRTDALARDAIAAGALDTVSGARIAGELMALAGEPSAVAALARAHAIGVDRALHPGFEPRLDLAEAARAHLAQDGRPALVVLAACCTRFERAELAAWLDRLELPAAERDAVVVAALDAEALAERLRHAHRPSEIAGLARGRPPEQLALAAALGAAEPVAQWRERLSRVALEIDGRDLAAAGVPRGPDVGRALHAALAAKLDGEAAGRDAELAAALRAVGRG
jgi:tRNA nucleotidyltransferase (CCA-adding enzyme)